MVGASTLELTAQQVYEGRYEWQQCDWCLRVRAGAAPRGWRAGWPGCKPGKPSRHPLHVACMGCVRRQRLQHWVPLRYLCLLPVLANHGPGHMVYDTAWLARLRAAPGMVQP